MSETNTNPEGAAHGNFVSYIAGFGLSVLLTLTAFYLVYQHNHSQQPIFSHKYLMGALLVLALSQLFVQLLFFLHLDRESKPLWNLQVAILAAGVVLILVIGSIWIMNNLNYNMNSSQRVQKYIHDQENSGL
jgi:cytochrome o ubiquinol oxidase operon protein cyoD